MLISKAYAQEVPGTAEVATIAEAPGTMEAFLWNMGLVGVLVALFYMLLIAPQKKRFKAHTEMLRALGKGDKVVTGGGLVGTISKITEGNDEVEVDLGGGMKVTALRSTLQGRSDRKAAPTKIDVKTDAKADTKTKKK